MPPPPPTTHTHESQHTYFHLPTTPTTPRPHHRFLGFVVFDSQMIVERAALGDADCVGHATTLLVDFVALFVRIAIILLRNQEKREDRERRNNRR